MAFSCNIFTCEGSLCFLPLFSLRAVDSCIDCLAVWCFSNIGDQLQNKFNLEKLLLEINDLEAEYCLSRF